ncbi:MAG: MBL fold metallo-hydrolase [Thermotogae bacterium]|nr:MBL fold metallo-hydrolase [Thermotogota bacterium]
MEELFPGIFVATSESGASNLGFVMGREGVIVIDTSLFVSKAMELKDYISSLTKKPILFVFNTHYHPDHTFGNSAFDSPILAHELTKAKMERMDDEYVKNIKEKIGPDVAEEFEDLSIRIPTETFKREKIIDLGNRKVKLLHVGGHTEDSSVAIVEPEMVVFFGDVLVNGYHPEIVADSDLKTWINILKKFLGYDISYAVPGHGKVSEKDSVEDMLNYLKTLRDFIANYKKQGIQRFIDRISEDENFVGRKFPELLLDDIRILLQMERKSRRL